MRDRSDRSPNHKAPLASPAVKRLGSYLIEAGLITPAQVDVVLNDQKMMDDLRFGEALVTRGWIKQQTLDYLIKKIVEPEQQALRQVKPPSPPPLPSDRPQAPTPSASRLPPLISEVKANSANANERKPRPAIASDDDEVGWVG